MISIIISRSRYYNLIEKSGRRALKNLEGKRQDITSSEASFLKRYTLYLFKKRESCFCKFTTTIRDKSAVRYRTRPSFRCLRGLEALCRMICRTERSTATSCALKHRTIVEMHERSRYTRLASRPLSFAVPIGSESFKSRGRKALLAHLHWRKNAFAPCVIFKILLVNPSRF